VYHFSNKSLPLDSNCTNSKTLSHASKYAFLIESEDVEPSINSSSGLTVFLTPLVIHSDTISSIPLDTSGTLAILLYSFILLDSF